MNDRYLYQRRWRAANRAKMRAYKRAYLKRLRSYPAAARRQAAKDAARQLRRRRAEAEVNRLQQRMAHRGMPLAMSEARDTLVEYGPHYPLARGLTHAGLLWVRRQQDGGSAEPRWRLLMEAYEVEAYRLDPQVGEKRTGRRQVPKVYISAGSPEVIRGGIYTS